MREQRQRAKVRHLRAVRRDLSSGKQPRKPWRALIAGGLTCLALLGFGAWHLKARLAGKVETVTVSRGTVLAAIDSEALVVRAENVYTAPVDGQVMRLIPEGQRARVGASVVTIAAQSAPTEPQPTPAPASTAALQRELDDLNGQLFSLAVQLYQARDAGNGAEADRIQEQMDQLALRQAEVAKRLGRTDAVTRPPEVKVPAGVGTEVQTEVSGVVLYQVDGLEEHLNPSKVDGWTPAWFHGLKVTPKPIGETVAAGEPVFKVVDSLSLGLVTTVPADRILPADGRVQVQLPGQGGRTVSARIARRVAGENQVLLYLTAPIWPDEFTSLRRARISIVLAEFNGLVVPRSSLGEIAGRQGVWVLHGGKRTFTPVTVLGGNETEVALEADIQPGAEILLAPPPEKL